MYNSKRNFISDLNGEIDYIYFSSWNWRYNFWLCKIFERKNKNIKIVAVEPSTSAVLSGNKSGSHGIQGIGAGFIPKNFDKTLVDDIIKIDTEKAYEVARECALKRRYTCWYFLRCCFSCCFKFKFPKRKSK